MKRGYPATPILDRFWRHLSLDCDTGCWLWMGSLDKDGYGYFAFGSKVRKKRQAHILAWEFYRGLVPTGFELAHVCRVRHCVNPDHLEIVTHKVNTLRGRGVGAVNARKTHCIHGHEFTRDNIYLERNGKARRCRTCQLARKRRA